jgi:hypothetical protein
MAKAGGTNMCNYSATVQLLKAEMRAAKQHTAGGLA